LYADALHLYSGLIVEARDSILDGQDTIIAVAGVVDGGSGTVREIAASHHDRRDLKRTELFVERRPVKRAPTGFVENPFMLRELLKFTSEQGLNVQRDRRSGLQDI
jgi:hypothetical protein